MEFERFRHILFERQDRVLTVTMNRPEKLNSWNDELHQEMELMFNMVARDTGSDVIILTGAGKAFSAGGDIEANLKLHYDNRLLHKTTSVGRRIISAMLEVHQPIICRMNGDAVGAGATIGLLCDIIIAANNARIGDPHVKVGLVAGDGGALIWPQLIGYARAKPYLFTGDLIRADKAAEIGLVSFAVEPEELDSTVRQWADKLASLPPKALRWTKATTNLPLKQLAATMMEPGMAYEAMSMYAEDFVEANKAFLEKRKPKYTGL